MTGLATAFIIFIGIIVIISTDPTRPPVFVVDTPDRACEVERDVKLWNEDKIS
jgi:hypothetical protein